jgi:two-component system sensor histidine kinase PilS (NtrC family)
MQLNRRDRAQTEVLELDAMLSTFVDEFDLAERLDPAVVVLAGVRGVKVPFDRGHLRQVLWNLCRNALRYGRKLPGSLRLTIGDDDGQLVLDVLDDGQGVPAEQQSKLFEPFFTTAEEGTGLGLYIAKELCEANGARLEYHAGEGSGACFRITFGKLNRDSEGVEYVG